jgi:hypothetical protein
LPQASIVFHREQGLDPKKRGQKRRFWMPGSMIELENRTTNKRVRLRRSPVLNQQGVRRSLAPQADRPCCGPPPVSKFLLVELAAIDAIV